MISIINPLHIDTASAAALRALPSYGWATQELFDGRSFELAYTKAGGCRADYNLRRRCFEIDCALAPHRLWLIHHALQGAKQSADSLFLRSPVIQELTYEPEEFCSLVAGWADSMCDYIVPACHGLRGMGIDPTNQYEQWFDDIRLQFRNQLRSIDAETQENGVVDWDRRWREYRSAATNWHAQHWMPFLLHCMKHTAA